MDTTDLDIPLALKRVKKDMRDDWFADPRGFNDMLVLENINDWLDTNPIVQRTEHFNIPKPAFVVRSAHEIFIYERILYQALIDRFSNDYDDLLSPHVYSHRIRPGENSYMFLDTIEGWKNFNRHTDSLASHEDSVVVITDIQNYFQCIRYERLCSQLRNSEPNSDGRYDSVFDRLEILLNNWNASGVGIPQNRDGSSFLGNIFLRGLDEFMILKGYNYFRYMDDIRIVCSDQFIARKALYELIIHLREYELGVNGKKTSIINRTEDGYRVAIPEDNPILEEIDALFQQKTVRSVEQARVRLDELANNLIANGETDNKEFRFCMYRIERLSRCSDIIYDSTQYIDVAIQLLINQPWSSDVIIRFLRSNDLSSNQVSRIIDITLCDRRNIYEWQSYLLWQLVAILNSEYRKNELKAAARDCIASSKAIPYKAGAALYLGFCGNIHDKEYLIDQCQHLRSNMLSRTLSIACYTNDQSLSTALYNRIIPACYRNSSNSDADDYFSQLPQLRASQIYSDLPCFYF
ncbi:MAG: RNA-directed DNA polymerase [Akkermansiaceae bacterium]